MRYDNSPVERATWAARIAGIAAPVFLATWNQRFENGELVIHISSLSNRAGTRKQVMDALGNCKVGRIRVQFHAPSKLTAPRSLEKLLRRFSADEIVFDPTLSISRARALVRCVEECRERLGKKMASAFYAPRERTLYISLDAQRLALSDKFKIAELAGIEKAMLASLQNAFGAASDCPRIRLGFGLPKTALVAVDHWSVISSLSLTVHTFLSYWKPAAIAAVLGFGATAAAAKEPAVSQINLKVVGEAGSTNDQSAWVAGGGLTAPLGESWGIQVEAGASGVDGDTTTGVAGHIFTRDPDKYLLGIFAAYAAEDRFDLEATRIGAEAELYLDQVSILAKAGYQFSGKSDDSFVGSVELKWYVSENFALSGGASTSEQTTIGHAGVEWQPGFSALPGLAFRVDGRFGEDDFDSVLGGITYYFGADASLKDRHRKQDPDLALIELFKSIEQERNKLCAAYGC